LIKQSLGLDKRSRSSYLLRAVNVLSVKDKLKRDCASLLRRIFAVPSPMRELSSHFISVYMCEGILYHGTLVNRIVNFGMSPVACIFNKYQVPPKSVCGVVDSLKVLLMNEHFIKPYSEEHILVSLLTQSF